MKNLVNFYRQSAANDKNLTLFLVLGNFCTKILGTDNGVVFSDENIPKFAKFSRIQKI